MSSSLKAHILTIYCFLVNLFKLVPVIFTYLRDCRGFVSKRSATGSGHGSKILTRFHLWFTGRVHGCIQASFDHPWIQGVRTAGERLTAVAAAAKPSLRLIDWVKKVLRPTRNNIGHYGDGYVLPSQSLGVVAYWRNHNRRNKSKQHKNKKD